MHSISLAALTFVAADHSEFRLPGARHESDLFGPDRKTCSAPGFDSAVEDLNVRVTLPKELLRLTGGCRVLRSGTIEDDLLLFPGPTPPEFLEVQRALQVVFATFFRVLIPADEHRLPRDDFPSSLFGRDANGLWHGSSPVAFLSSLSS